MGLIRFRIEKQINRLKLREKGVIDTTLQGINNVVLAQLLVNDGQQTKISGNEKSK